MNAPIFTQENLLFTVTTPLGDNKLLFKSLQGEEQLSSLFHFQLELLSESKQLNFKDIIGQPLSVKVQFAPAHQRYFHGLVTRFVQAGTDARFTIYHAEVRPWLWLLTLTKNCQIFQNLSVPDIIKKVFNDMGFSDYRLLVFYRYEPREYCVQYEETAFNFVSRLMEDEGLFYFFEHHEDKHVLVIADDLGKHQPCPGIPTARFLQVVNDTQPEDAVTECYFSQQITTGKYAVDDFNFETPANDLKTSVNSETHPLRVYEYSAGFSNRDQGERKVRCRIEGCTAEQQLIEGQGHCFSFIAGYKFTLTDHPRDEFNQEYVLLWLSHSLSLTHYSNAFRAFPATVSFRPPIITPKPRLVSTQTAIVTGPPGQEIWTDKYGRIKVQFHWDQEGQYDENSSCWVRVNQGWAGKGYGNICIPRIGQEVIISFINSDPDRPLVTGGVYNAQQTVPYPLPAGQNKSTLKSNTTPGGGGSNEIRLDDSKGQEEMFIHAQKDQNEVVENNQTMTVKVNRTKTINGTETTTVKGDRTETVSEGHESVTINTGNRTVEVKTGNDTLIVGTGNRVVQVKSNDNVTVEGNKTLNVVGNISILKGGATGDGADGIMIEAAGENITLKTGASSIILHNDGRIEINGIAVAINGQAEVAIHGGDVYSTADNSHNTSGALVVSDGSATNTVKGGAVLLNP